jgi:hypothetical protein
MRCMDVNTKQSRLPRPIAQMGAWDFWADAYSIGLTREDAEAITNGTALPDQIDRARVCGQAAKMTLLSADGVYPARRSS